MIQIFRGLEIRDEHLNGCFINNDLYIPNGTGPSELFGSDFLAEVARDALALLPSDKYQAVASFFHDIFYKIGGSKWHRRKADIMMRKLAIAVMKKDLGFWNPRRYTMKVHLWRNYWSVRIKGAETFNFNDSAVPVVRSYTEWTEYNNALMDAARRRVIGMGDML